MGGRAKAQGYKNVYGAAQVESGLQLREAGRGHITMESAISSYISHTGCSIPEAELPPCHIILARTSRIFAPNAKELVPVL